MERDAPAADGGAPAPLDRERLLRVFLNAIDLEAAGCMGGDRISGDCSKERVLLRLHCRIAVMLRDMDCATLGAGLSIAGRRHGRAV